MNASLIQLDKYQEAKVKAHSPAATELKLRLLHQDRANTRVKLLELLKRTTTVEPYE